jgi:hypothetical protein
MPNAKQVHHVMVDLETYGLKEDAVILSAAFIYCDKEWNELEARYAVFDLPTQQARGRTVDESTMKWWSKQKPEILARATENPQPVVDALFYLFEPTKTTLKGKKFLWWGNSAIFDLLKINSLSEMYLSNFDSLEMCTIDEYVMRCYKTTRDIFRDYVGLKEFYGAATHDAVEDARRQVAFMKEVFKVSGAFNNMLNPGNYAQLEVRQETIKPPIVTAEELEARRFAQPLSNATMEVKPQQNRVL